jgi:hypothetical protein
VLNINGAGSYLRQIAAMHDWKRTAADVVQLQQDLQASLYVCAKQLVLPEVKVRHDSIPMYTFEVCCKGAH